MIHCILLAIVFVSSAAHSDDFGAKLAAAAIERTHKNIRYDGRYLSIEYPGGDVPDDIGVCTDVIVRAYRSLGMDLQQLVHEDMASAFTDYPSKRIWGHTQPDSNIDHRRVPNLRAFFRRHGVSLNVSSDAAKYKRGDIVTWSLLGNLPHIGIVVSQQAVSSGNPLIVHNIGSGPKMEDVLFSFPITGHYRYAFDHTFSQ